MNGRALLFSLTIALQLPACAEWANPPSTPAPPPPKDNSIDITAEPSHHLAVETQAVRAFKVEVQPDAATLKHRHSHDYVTVTIGAAELSNEVEGKPPAKVSFDDGEVRFSQGGITHIVRNVAPTTFRNLTIELLEDGAKVGISQWEEDHGTVSFPGGTQELLFARGSLRVSKVNLAAGATVPRSQFANRCLFVAVNDLDLRDEKNTRVQLQPGNVKWDDNGMGAKLTNKGKDARIVLLEFK